MKSKALEFLSPVVRKKLKSIGKNISMARRRRKQSQKEFAERCRISITTLKNIESGDPAVGFGLYGMALHALGLSNDLDLIGAPERDSLGNLITESELPKRIKKSKS
ncbi:helix-turn-helix transcriptional regulator [Thiomicrorhabdus sp. 6S2-11]|uniref:Helix-turn-helix transcriptional regulator n=1 Tax=Thiomicrorhabdus marina TaxID=2818442 RepID=A0ABS3Q5G7_9GAMM|nr:helix-turn-helix transcriptional regulator [Thiomicrorhabdus marina]MBO1927575.1 helix-turn-helix transcriptional regulator [Thiomicrorhabdus marina]